MWVSADKYYAQFRKAILQAVNFIFVCTNAPRSIGFAEPFYQLIIQTAVNGPSVFTFAFCCLQSFLKGETQIMADEAFQNAVQSYYDVFLKSERVIKMVQSGACSQHDFREVFRNNIEKRVRYAIH